MLINQLFGFGVIIVVMLVGFDFLARSVGPRTHAGYRRAVNRFGRTIWRQIVRFARFVWTRYRLFVLGVIVGFVLAMILLGHLL